MYKHVVTVGLGGIWSYLWVIVGKTMTFSKRSPKALILADGDQFTTSNMERQDMEKHDTRRLKAEVYAERMMTRFPKLKVQMVPNFLTKDNVGKIIRERTIVLSCVDNHATRKLLADTARKKKNVAIITGANDLDRGNAHLHIIENGKQLTLGMDDCHPEVKNPKDRNPGELSCEEIARLPGGGQLAIANMMSASLMASYFWYLTNGEKRKDLRGLITRSETFYHLDKFLMDSTSRAVK